MSPARFPVPLLAAQLVDGGRQPLQTALDLPGMPQTEEARAASAAARGDAEAMLAGEAHWLLPSWTGPALA